MFFRHPYVIICVRFLPEAFIAFATSFWTIRITFVSQADFCIIWTVIIWTRLVDLGKRNSMLNIELMKV